MTPARRGGHNQRGTVWPRVGARWGRRPDVVGPPVVCDELRVGLTDGGYTGCAMRAHWVRVECAQGMQSTRLGTWGAHTGAKVSHAHTRCAGRAHESSQMSRTGHTEGTPDARSALGERDGGLGCENGVRGCDWRPSAECGWVVGCGRVPTPGRSKSVLG